MNDTALKDLPVIAWNTPAERGPEASMPIGNGDLAANVYVEKDGGLVLLLALSGAFSAENVLEKAGRVRLQLDPNPFRAGLPFQQTLRLDAGWIAIHAGAPGHAVTIRVWVDANAPILRVEASGERPFRLAASVECWRGDRDCVVADPPRHILWYTRNTESTFARQLAAQDLAGLERTFADPDLHRTWGGLMWGDGLTIGEGGRELVTESALTQVDLRIAARCAQTVTAQAWMEDLRRAADASPAPSADCFDAHRRWWRDFWSRSYIRVREGEDAAPPALDEAWCDRQRPLPDHTRRLAGSDATVVAQGYAVQRYLTACCGRGSLPIKFNGALFCLDNPIGDEGRDPDFRRWGGHYWFQNTRLTYWPMLHSGDADLMAPFFRMYREMLPFREAVTQRYGERGGAFFPETISWWGLPREGDYGVDPAFRACHGPGEFINPYIRYYGSGALELCIMMLEAHAFNPDAAFLSETLLPVADAVLRYYDEHFPRDGKGRVRIAPSQSLETYWTTLPSDLEQGKAKESMEVVNPLPEIAGLTDVIGRLLESGHAALGEARETWLRRFRSELPPIPMAETDDGEILAPAERHSPVRCNEENPELYALFPYRLFGLPELGKGSLDCARRSVARRQTAAGYGWSQDEIHYAMAGMAEEARAFLARRARSVNAQSRFPFWGPNYDWVPDMDHGGSLAYALQVMLMQCAGDRIVLLPAWPAGWDVEFRLHAPRRTVVEGRVEGGRLAELRVEPESRRKDVTIRECAPS